MLQKIPTPYLTEKQAAKLYGYSRAWFQRKRWQRDGPPFRKIGRSVRYPADELEKWFSRHPLRGQTSF